MTAQLTHQSCPDCGSNGCLTVFDDGGSYCHSCNKKKKGKVLSISFDKDTEVLAPYRSIPKSVVDFYGVTTGIDNTGKHTYRRYPYPHMDKFRVLPKDFSKNSGFKSSQLFGMNKFNAGSSKYITVVEGEDDVLSAYYMLGEKFPVVGLPSASAGKEFYEKVYSYLNAFDQIIVCTDNDAAGKAAADRIASIFPGKVYKVSLTMYKDPQEYLANNKEKDFYFAWNNRQKYVPDYITNQSSKFLEILRQDDVNEYKPTPITELNDHIKGLMRGHLTILCGPEGQGKTEIMRMFEYDLLSNHPDTSIAVLHMEESKKTTLISYACYALRKNVRDPDHSVPQAQIDKAIEDLTEDERLYLVDFSSSEDPLDIIDKVNYLATVCGCHYIFIDPIQQLSYGRDSDKTEEQTLSEISVKLEKMATDLNVGIVITAHVNDDGQTRSSRMIGKSASIRIDLERDHLNSDPEVRNTTKLTIKKNRPLGSTGFGGMLRFDPTSFTLEEAV